MECLGSEVDDKEDDNMHNYNAPFVIDLPMVITFKYRIGDVFLGDNDTIVEVIGYNYTNNTYKTKATMMIDGVSETMENEFLTDHYLEICEKFSSMKECENFIAKRNDEMNKKTKKGKTPTAYYKIYYLEEESKQKQADTITIPLPSIKKLASVLNKMKAKNPNRRIITVCVVDEVGYFLSSVKLLPQEIKQQYFITGMRQRLLAHAKYECGYEVSIGF
jgi:1-aminocyclopropane-1-carboxylate deaminase/D-cysteine desulfhydrase-like pyridoxal-dependent ACC family enzyme